VPNGAAAGPSGFRTAAGKPGLAIEIRTADETKTFTVPSTEKLGRITDVVTAVRQSGDLIIIGLGIAALAQDSRIVEYRLIEGRGKEPDLLTGKGWTASHALITRPPDAPFAGMSVSLPEGDSIMLTLQEIRRDVSNPDNDRIETHVFVNHCPAGGDLITKMTNHYVSVMTAPIRE
jgi:hypothetical protein